MPNPNQEIRPSQYILTYGPGSILETRSGPVVMRSMDTVFHEIGKTPDAFEIIDERLTKTELGGARIARLPTNAETLVSSGEAIYPADRFPFWSLCTKHGTEHVLYDSSAGCPKCGYRDRKAIREKAGREAIRFVMACSAGHLDDVDWHRVVHRSRGSCRPSHYIWTGGGRSLRYVSLKCPQCGATVNFGDAYREEWPCSGRQPEFGGRPKVSDCRQPARIIQRGAANLRLPAVVSALTILDMPSRLFSILSDIRVRQFVETLRRHGLLDETSFRTEMAHVGLRPDELTYIEHVPWSELCAALQDMALSVSTTRGDGIRDQEFRKLSKAADTGSPAQPAQAGSQPIFEVKSRDVRRCAGPAGRVCFRVVPVSRLRMVLVQKGYQRLDPQRGTIVSTGFFSGARQWYPGLELHGEGIFIDAPDASLNLQGSRADAWQRWFAERPSPNERVHPVQVWWHTLAHRLLRALSIDSGYGLAAIRERIYTCCEATGEVHGGILLYAVQPGGDGTMGGLLALTQHFARVLSRALDDIASCSNDPLCGDVAVAHGQGAACYSCLLVSETSCEMQNLALDRLLLVENLP